MKNLNHTEIARAEEIIAAGLKKAAESLSFFMQETIQLQETDFTISTKFNHANSSNTTEELFVLSTELKGNLNGVCYLVFTEAESNEICKVALSPDIYNNPQKLENMKEPLLLEVDNILSASVITQLANQLHVKVHGGVPSMRAFKQTEFNEFIEQQMIPNKFLMGFQTEFISTKAHFHPSFLWILEPDFVERVKETILEKTD